MTNGFFYMCLYFIYFWEKIKAFKIIKYMAFVLFNNVGAISSFYVACPSKKESRIPKRIPVYVLILEFLQ